MFTRAIFASAAAACAFAFLPAQASANVVECNGSTGPNGYAKASNGASLGFWTWFTIGGSSNDCITVDTSSRTNPRKASFAWSLSGDGSDAVGGIGWDLGSASRTIKYKLTNASNLTGKLSIGVYGWTCNRKIVEYYVVDSYNGSYVPYDEVARREATPIKWRSGAERRITSDGGTYRVYVTQRINAGNACGGNTNFLQYWSVRTSSLAPGSTTRTISMKNHVDGWAAMGYTLGDFTRPATGKAYQVVGAEGLNTSTGNVTIDVE